MPNYQNARIYVLKRTKNNKVFYVGSTINPLSKRLSQHKEALSNEKTKDFPVYRYINKKGGKATFYIELYKRYPCHSREELNKMEGRVIQRLQGRGIKLYNKAIAGQTRVEWRQKYQLTNEYKKRIREIAKTDKYKKYQQEYKKIYNKTQKFKDYQKQHQSIKITCDCGRNVLKYQLSRHEKSFVHQRLMAQKKNEE